MDYKRASKNALIQPAPLVRYNDFNLAGYKLTLEVSGITLTTYVSS